MTIMELLKDHQTGQDDIQLQCFVLGGRTTWGTYKQALRELYKRVRGLREAQTSLDLLRLEIGDKQDVISGKAKPKSLSDVERSMVEIRQLYGRLEESERAIVDLKREAAIFYREARKLKDEIGEVTPERRTELDLEEWKHWNVKRAMIGKLTMGRIPEVVLKNLYSLPNEERMEILELITNNRAEDFIESGEHGRLALPPPTESEIKLLEGELENDNLIDG